jgi:hypothetical protein
MNIDKFKHQHIDILAAIGELRQLVQSGIGEHAADIAQRIVAMSGIIKLHLAVEDRILYPAERMKREDREFYPAIEAI